mmetsp:Transcript_10875/g.27236  ORF Transcript_10875/g.27236 Transcript_10875/m.27236 type:complete len:226 (-) Transcript_10875:35-712(-)
MLRFPLLDELGRQLVGQLRAHGLDLSPQPLFCHGRPPCDLNLCRHMPLRNLWLRTNLAKLGQGLGEFHQELRAQGPELVLEGGRPIIQFLAVLLRLDLRTQERDAVLQDQRLLPLPRNHNKGLRDLRQKLHAQSRELVRGLRCHRLGLCRGRICRGFGLRNRSMRGCSRGCHHFGYLFLALLQHHCHLRPLSCQLLIEAFLNIVLTLLRRGVWPMLQEKLLADLG